jgi:hypothetical protein
MVAMTRTIDEIAEAAGARVVVRPASAPAIGHVLAGDRISDLLDESSDRTLVVTNLASRQLLELADLMDVPAVCFLRGVEPDAALAESAAARGTALLVSPADMYETCGRIWACFQRSGGAGATDTEGVA